MKQIKRITGLMCLLLMVLSIAASAASLPKYTKESQYNFKPAYTRSQINARKQVLKVAKSYLKIKEKSAKHKKIIKIYNGIKNNMYRRGKYMHYKATTKVSWCDIFVTAVFKQANKSSAVGAECGCQEHIDLLKKMGCWVENDAYVPNTGDLIFYYWKDSGKGDCRGWADHVGIVVSVKNNIITTIEGNYNDTVKYRSLKVNGRYIRGFGVPRY